MINQLENFNLLFSSLSSAMLLSAISTTKINIKNKQGWQSHRRYFVIFVTQSKCDNDLDQWIQFFAIIKNF